MTVALAGDAERIRRRGVVGKGCDQRAFLALAPSKKQGLVVAREEAEGRPLAAIETEIRAIEAGILRILEEVTGVG